MSDTFRHNYLVCDAPLCDSIIEWLDWKNHPHTWTKIDVPWTDITFHSCSLECRGVIMRGLQGAFL